MTVEIDSTTAIALWGAFAGTLAIGWDAYKWWADGPRLRVTANPNMQRVDLTTGRLDNEQLILVRVVNVGTRSTKVTYLVASCFTNRLRRLFGKRERVFVVLEPTCDTPLPVVLEPGQDWSAFISREEATKIAGTAVLYCGVEHSLGKRPVLARIAPKSLRLAVGCTQQEENKV